MTKPGIGPVADLSQSIADVAAMFDGAIALAESGQLVELDLLAMRVAILCDAITGLDPASARNMRDGLADLVARLNRLDVTLRRRKVDLTLDLEQANKRLRAQAAYGASPAPKLAPR
jgi:hypothetical protein